MNENWNKENLINLLMVEKWKINIDFFNKERNLNKFDVGKKSKNVNKWY